MTRAQDTVFDLSSRVDDMEDSVEDNDEDPPDDLAEDQRMAIRLRRYLAPQRDALIALVGTDSALVTSDARARLRGSGNLAKLAVKELEMMTGRMQAVQHHHATRADQRQTRNGHILSIVAAVFLQLGFITGLFGVSVAGMPGADGHPPGLCGPAYRDEGPDRRRGLDPAKAEADLAGSTRPRS
jgi:zinc transporter